MNKRLFEEQEYWFPAKKYGWGWGLPVTWQGWASLIIYLVLVVCAARVFPPSVYPSAYVISILVLSGILIYVCWLKGEPIDGNWGGDGLY